MADYYDPTATPTANFSSGSTTFTFGNKFTVASTVTATSLRWWVSVTGDGTPTHLRLWNADTGALLRDAVPSGSSVAGWNSVSLSSPVDLVSGVNYVLGAVGNPGFVWRGWTTSPPSINSPYNHVGCRYGDGSTTDPAGVSGFELLALSPGSAGSGGGTGGSDGSTGAGGPAYSGDIEAWLSDDGTKNLHQTDGIPWQLWLADQALRSGLGTAITGYYKRLEDAVAAIRAKLPTGTDTIPGMLNAMLATLQDRFTATNAAIASVQAQVNAALAGQGGTEGSAIGALSNRTGFPSSPWALVDETDFDTDLAWNVPADLYVVTITTLPAGVAPDDFAGVNWLHRLGSWAPLDSTQIAGPRGFIEFSPQQLHMSGWRMPGLALRCKQATLGHVQAWELA